MPGPHSDDLGPVCLILAPVPAPYTDRYRLRGPPTPCTVEYVLLNLVKDEEKAVLAGLHAPRSDDFGAFRHY